ncbi:DUF547 domain-containing protein [Formosa sp. L2A11]|uniref:DUF547 domain-containing protein n=1 Tax=Formosa sp. L2A11 TaxID=2686363 RepID=UPI00131B77EC|nr:DUF547 domain-containing protein [Formosa sp. L2A11]
MKNYILLIVVPLLSLFAFNSINKAPIGFQTYNENTIEAPKPIDHTLWNALLSKYVSKDGHVNYKGFKADEQRFQEYLEILKQDTPSSSWTKNEKLAYWINAYNAFTIQLILDNYPVKSIKDIKDPWDLEFIKIADKTYSLGDIEHKILRKMDEPRIHFAINCASYSCPNLLNEAYNAEDLNEQLNVAATQFVNDTSKNTISKDKVEVSKIFDWFSSDFKKQGSVVDFLNTYSTIKIDSKAKVKYRDYNWNLND